MEISSSKNILLKSVIFGIGLMFMLFSLSSIGSAQVFIDQYVAGELIVKYKNSDQVYKILVPNNSDLLGLIEQYNKLDVIEYIELNSIFKATMLPDDPHYIRQNYLLTTNTRNAWSRELLAREQEGVTHRSVIAILDTGVDLDHQDLAEQIWKNSDEVAGNGIDDDGNGYIDDVNGWDFINENNDPNPEFSAGFKVEAVNHGTIVAGVAAAAGHNKTGIAGVSWNSDIMVLRVLDSQGNGDAFDVVRAIDYAIANGAHVINMSFVGPNFSQSLLNAIKRAYDAGVVVVVAAGNTDTSVNGQNLNLVKNYPVCYGESFNENIVIGVASVDSNLKKSAFSNYGSCIDLVAPGEGFFATEVYQPEISGFSNYYGGLWSGTSVSAPLVSGAAGMILALRPGLSVDQVRDAIISTTKSVDDTNPQFRGQLGGGMLNVDKALEVSLGQRGPISNSGSTKFLVAGLGYGSFPHVKVLTLNGDDFKSFLAYSPFFSGAINIAVGDVNGDGRDEIITGAGVGGGPHVRIFSIEGIMSSEFFAHDASSRSGVNVATGDFDGDGDDEVVTSAGRGDLPYVRVYSPTGELLLEFLAYAADFKGGVHLAVGDINGDGRDDIVTGAGAGGGPHVRVFSMEGNLIAQFFAYNKNFKGGVNVATGDVFGTGSQQIIASIESNSLPTVRIFDHRGSQLGTFFALEPGFINGVEVAAGDIDNDGVDEIISGPGDGGPAEIKIFDREGRLKRKINAHHASFLHGVRPQLMQY